MAFSPAYLALGGFCVVVLIAWMLSAIFYGYKDLRTEGILAGGLMLMVTFGLLISYI